jgi:hypothetical protein
MLGKSSWLMATSLACLTVSQLSFAQFCGDAASTVTLFIDGDGRGGSTGMSDCSTTSWYESNFSNRAAGLFGVENFNDEISSVRFNNNYHVQLSLFVDADYKGSCITFFANGGRLINLRDYGFHDRISSAILNADRHGSVANCRVVDLDPLPPPPPLTAAAFCPETYVPTAFTGRVAKAAFYNGWTVNARVTLYHPNNGQKYETFTITPGRNNTLGSYPVGDDWGVCIENIPGVSGRVYHPGTIAAYNPTGFSGQPLFMIQNDRL